MLEKVTNSLKKVYKILTDAGYECFIVGGSTRDYLTNKKDYITDFDLATDALPAQVMGLFRCVIPTGIKHGTVTVLMGKEQFEVTTYRLDGKYTDGRRPDTINFTKGIQEDLKRRDFTMNSVAYDLGTDTFLDPNGGIVDIENKIIRAIGDPLERFKEDGLRPLRAIRFVSQLGFCIEKRTLEAIKVCKTMINRVSCERINTEFFKLVQGCDTIRAVMIMQDVGMISELLPGSNLGMKFQSSGEFLHYFSHISKNINMINPKNLAIRFLFVLCLIRGSHSIEDRPSSIEYFQWIAQKYRFSKKITSTISHLLGFIPFEKSILSFSNYQVRQLLKDIGMEYHEDLILIWRALSHGEEEYTLVEEAAGLFTRILAIPHTALSLRDLQISGDELVHACGLTPGKKIGELLNHLLEFVLEDPANNEKEKLLSYAQQILPKSAELM